MTERNQSHFLVWIVGLAVLGTAVGVGIYQLSDDQPGQPGQSIEGEIADAAQGRTQVASYQSAAVYAASTDFYFEDDNGQVIEFRVSNLPEEQTIELPDDLLEAGVIEGPPGANPDLVGQRFTLIYDDRDELIRVERK